MADLLVGYDPSKPVGQRLAPEVRTELMLLAPVTMPNGSITGPKIANEAVDTGQVNAGAVTGEKIANEAVDTGKVKAGAVTGEKIADAAITKEKVSAGVATTVNATGDAIQLTLAKVTATEYAALTPDPNTAYFITG